MTMDPLDALDELRRGRVRAFWGCAVIDGDRHAAREKYDRLAALASLPPQTPARVAAIRSIARDFPGALREAELCGPTACARRRSVTLRASLATREAWCAAASSREVAGAVMQPGEQVAPTAGGGLRIVGVPTVLDPDAVAVTAWGVLHPRIADILAARARLPAGATLGDLPEAAGEGAIARWPEVRASGPLAALPLRPRTAYLWLAWEAGLDLVTLYRVLFTRIGSWARRADDPPWVHARGYARLGALASEVGGERGS